jgi:hypothetical protein
LKVEEADAVVGQAHAGWGQLALKDQVLEIALEISAVKGVGRTASKLRQVPYRGEVALVGAGGEAMHLHGRDHALT